MHKCCWKWREGIVKYKVTRKKKTFLVSEISLSIIQGHLPKNYFHYLGIILLRSSYSLSLALYQEETCQKFEPFVPFPPLCKHTVHISSNEGFHCCSQLSHSHPLVMQKWIKLLWVRLGMLRTNQGSYSEAHVGWVDHNVRSVCRRTSFFPLSSSHLHICARYAWQIDY